MSGTWRNGCDGTSRHRSFRLAFISSCSFVCLYVSLLSTHTCRPPKEVGAIVHSLGCTMVALRQYAVTPSAWAVPPLRDPSAKLPDVVLKHGRPPTSAALSFTLVPVRSALWPSSLSVDAIKLPVAPPMLPGTS